MFPFINARVKVIKKSLFTALNFPGTMVLLPGLQSDCLHTQGCSSETSHTGAGNGTEQFLTSHSFWKGLKTKLRHCVEGQREWAESLVWEPLEFCRPLISPRDEVFVNVNILVVNPVASFTFSGSQHCMERNSRD